MTRPRAEHPTPGELEILKVLWDRGAPATVREVMEVVNARGGPSRAYTSVMSLLNVMAEKGQLVRLPRGRAYAYEPATPRERTLGSMLGETLRRAYDGSASLLITHLLDQSRPSADELEEIRALLDRYEARRPEEPGEGGPP
jgi:predicted transcriptional regulator